MFKKLTVRSRTRIVLWWTLVLSATLIFVSLIGDQSSTAQKVAVTQSGDTLVVQTSSGSVVSSAPGSVNPQTDSQLRVLLEKYPGTWKAYFDKGRTKTLRPVSRIPVTTDPREFSSQLLTDVSQVFGVAAQDLALVTNYSLRQKQVVEYKQTFGGVPIEYSYITILINDLSLEQVATQVYPEVSDVLPRPVPRLDQQGANLAIQNDPELKKAAAQYGELTYDTSLVILPEAGSFILSWKIAVKAKQGLFAFTYYVDDANGLVVKKYSNVVAQKAPQQPSSTESKEESRIVLSVPLTPKSPEKTLRYKPDAPKVPQKQVQENVGLQTWQHILSENFDTLAFPYSPWSVFDNNGSTGGQLFWDDQNCIFNDPNWSLWAAAGGTNRLNACTDNYANNMSSWVTYGPFSLSGAVDGLLDFHYRNDSELNFDYFNWFVSVDGTNFHGFKVSGSSNGWQYASLDFKNVPTLGNILGRPQVWIAFLFTSDGSIVSGKGPFVDDVAVKKLVNSTCTGVSGSVKGWVYGKNKFETSQLNFKNQKVILNHTFAFDSQTVTDSNGNYSSSECPDFVRFELQGQGSRNFVKVLDCNSTPCTNGDGDLLSSGDVSISSQVANYVWNEDEDDKKEVSVFWHVNEIHDWFVGVVGQDLLNYQMQAYVDWVEPGRCPNAFYDRNNIYFCPPDYSKESDVIYHEYTHGVVDHIPNYPLPYQDETGALNEGIADYVAASKNNDPLIDAVSRSLTSVVNYSDKCNQELLGNCAATKYWLRFTAPDDFNDVGYVHHNSLVVSGALWNLRQNQGLTSSFVDNLVIDTFVLQKPNSIPDLLEKMVVQDGGARESKIRAAFATRGVGTPLPVLTSNLVISPSGTHTVGQTITGTFSITNRSSLPVTLEVLTIGGRLNNDTTVRDFPFQTNVTINANQTITYQKTFLISEAGNYRFFPAYRLAGGVWKTGLLHEIPRDPATLIDLISFTVGSTCNAPGSFTLTGPTNGQTLSSTTTVNLTWNSSANANSYEVYFGTSSNPPLLGTQTGTSRVVNVTPGQTYFWKVVAKVNCGTATTTAGVWSFKVQATCNAPGAFSLSSPTNGQTLTSTTSVNLTWGGSANANSYEVFFGTSSNPPSIGTQTGTSRTVIVTPGQTYFWKVVAKVNCGSATATTAVRSFSVQSSCSYSISSSANTVGPGSGSGSFLIDTTSGCSWSAVSDSPSWLTTSSSGTGDGSIHYNFAANNSTSSRIGHITVGGRVSTITQIGIGGGGSVRLSSSTYSVNENGGAVTITVNRSGGTHTGTVQYSTSNGTATAGSDYTATSGLLLFGTNETSKTFTIPILNDTASEANESINVTLFNQSLSFTLGSPSSATVTIVDNDAVPAPTANSATGVTNNNFIANWGSSPGATGYRLDVSTNSSFTNFVSGYQNLDVGNAFSRNVTGLTGSTTYFYRVRAYKSTFTSGNSNTVAVSTTGLMIFIEQGTTNHAAAVDSVTWLRGPFRVIDFFGFAADNHTRVVLFTSDLGLTQPDPAQLTVRAGGVALTVEYIGQVFGVPGMTASYLVVRLPDGLPAGDLPVVVTLRGVASINSPTLGILP
ncbi:MAG TPA: Calx-beta domain-containing protein [Pyrinomonadaceae bacterium]|nr:Calx-beta domain-containing protein [Pyrinomonadaceae bacterium]